MVARHQSMRSKQYLTSQNIKCEKCGSKTCLYLTKVNSKIFCFDCLKVDSRPKIRALLCPKCGAIKRVRRLPLHPPRAHTCSPQDQSILTGSFIGKTLVLLCGALLALAFRHRSINEIDSITSVPFWLSILSGAILLLFATWVYEEKFDKNINKEIIQGTIMGSCIGFTLWTLDFYAANVLPGWLP
jgi:hypothetical protein